MKLRRSFSSLCISWSELSGCVVPDAVVELRRLVTERAVLAPRIEEYAHTPSISRRPPKGQTKVARTSMAPATGRRPVEIMASRWAFDFVRIIVLTNSVLTWSGLAG